MFFKAKFSLADHGDEFVNSYITVKLLDKNQIIKFNKGLAAAMALVDVDEDGAEKVLDIMYKIVKDCFVEGMVFDVDADRPMKKVDIDSLPPAIIKDLSSFIQGSLQKKV